MKKIITSITFLVFCLSVVAQIRETGLAAMQKDVWAQSGTEYKTTIIPETLKKESAIVIARSIYLTRSMKGSRSEKLFTWHERVKINDKVALSEYSTLSYQKRVETSVGGIFFMIRDKKETSIGVKIVKPNGREEIVPSTEEVILKNENSKDMQGKLAIPGLEAGDILDYYISSSRLSMTGSKESYGDNEHLIMLADEHPIMSLDLQFQFSKKIDVQCIYANGAPQLEETKDQDENRVFRLKQTNLPKYQSQLWISPLRQYPYIEIGSSYSMDFSTLLRRKRDESGSRFIANKEIFEHNFNETYSPGFDGPKKQLKEYFDGGKGFKNASQDTLLKTLYKIWKYNTFCTYTSKDLSEEVDFNRRMANSQYHARMMSMLLTDMKIDHDVVLVSSRNSNSLENAYNNEDFNAVIRVNDSNNKYHYLCFDDVFTHFGEIPARFQGEKTIVLTPKRKSAQSYLFEESTGTMPVSTGAQNISSEQLDIALLAENMQKLKVERVVRETGELRHNSQKGLLSYGRIDNYYTSIVKGDDLQKRLSKNQDTKKMTEAFQSAFAVSDGGLTNAMTREIKSIYDQDAGQVTNCKINNDGLDDHKEGFEYSSSFVLNNMVKKAGNNYIIEVGKLTGGFLKLEDKDKIRKIDAYLPSARAISYTISFTIPNGYQVKGIEELNKRVTNKTGFFTALAMIKGNILNINLTRAYNNNFEKSNDWPLLYEIIDAAADFNGKQVLLEKKP